MRTVRASAPGKAVLSGEYVVLDGAPAVAVALDRRVRVTVTEASTGSHELTTPGLAEGSWEFATDKGGNVDWLEGSAQGRFGLFEIIWRRVAPQTDQCLIIHIDSGEFLDARSGAKLGLGSSAAVATALSAALGCYSADATDTLAIAIAAHREFQGGHGSGVDVVTSYSGGALSYRQDSADLRALLDWPHDLSYQFFWSGTAASTAQRVARYRDVPTNGAADTGKQQLVTAAETTAAKWRDGEAQQLLASYANYNDALQSFSDVYDLDIFAAGHREMTALASDSGIVYKPCGAGGGDIGVALATDASALDAFCERVGRYGFRQLDVLLEQQGLMMQVETKT